MPLIEIIAPHGAVRIPRRRLKRLLQLVAARESRRPLARLTVVFVTDRRLRRINRQFLNHDHATDVLSFDLADRPSVIDGEIYVSYQRAAAQARAFGVSFTNEVLRLAAHGLLHLFGHDDATEQARADMINRGDRYLALERAAHAR